MSLFDTSYVAPGVYTEVDNNGASANLLGNARVPVLIGEGEETTTYANVQIHRGSSAVVDDQVVGESLANQVDGSTRSFQLSHYPVVDGSGKGVITTDVSKVTAAIDGISVAVISLNGRTGVISLQDIPPDGSDLTVSYYFKKTDTQVLSEDISYQIPSFATLVVSANLTLTLSIPGAIGDTVSLTLTDAGTGHGVTDAAAVTGSGSDAISIEIRKTDNTVRTLQDLANLVTAGISTLSAGYLQVLALGTVVPATPMTLTQFSSGAGQNTNTVFKVKNVPIVDGSNGGVTTTSPSDVQLVVNGVTTALTAVDGSTGLITSSVPLKSTDSARVTYYTNTYQNTSDTLSGGDVLSISKVGLAPNRQDFEAGTDYILSGNSIAWGASSRTDAATSTPGFTAFDAMSIETTLVDEKAYLRPVTGTVDGRNLVFLLQDSPVDGSGLSRATDDPTLISVFVGADPVSALTAGKVRVSRVSGASGQITLYNPPSVGSNVYASYYRSTLNDHEYTMTVTAAGTGAGGTFTIMDEQNRVVPVTALGTAAVTNGSFATTGIVWPSSRKDLVAPAGAPDETITLTFQDDGLSTITTSAVQASLTVSDSTPTPKLVLRATNPGVGGNSVSITFVAGAGAADAAAIAGAGTNSLMVSTVKADNSTVRTWQEIITLFSTYPAAATTTAGGVILASAVANADLTGQAVAHGAASLTGGAAAVTSAYAVRFKVTSSRSAATAQADGKGRTGSATTPGTANTGSNSIGAVGYLGQTYIDAVTGVKFTVVDPASALNYGYTTLPSPSYKFAPGDTLSFTVSEETGFASNVSLVNIPGLVTEVISTVGMNPGDTALLSTFNKSGDDPNVGDFYYVTYAVEKPSSAFGLRLFSSVNDAYAAYGQPSITNRLSLGIKLMIANMGNNSQQFACVQVPKQAALGTGSDQGFMDAIALCKARIPGSARSADAYCALSTSATVQQYLGRFLTTQSNLKAEAIGFVGFDRYSTQLSAQATAQGLANNRVIAVAPFIAGVSLSSSPTATAIEYSVSGEFMAAALMGLALNPANDVATTLTNQSLVGFTKILKAFDDPTYNQMAVAGLTVLLDNAGSLLVRHYKTTDPSNALTSEPYVTTIEDKIVQDFRTITQQFIGRKEIEGLSTSIQAVGNAYLKSKVGVLITKFTPLVVTPDPNDPTVYNVSTGFCPLFSLLYINLTFNVTLV